MLIHACLDSLVFCCKLVERLQQSLAKCQFVEVSRNSARQSCRSEMYMQYLEMSSGSKKKLAAQSTS